ncbi:MAG: hypothetical protein ACFFEY_03430 [Candidatus Thorarchaeota archaeon]
MSANTKCDKCGCQMTNIPIKKLNKTNCIHHLCSKCGHSYETGLRYNRITDQNIKYIRYNP